MNYLAHFHLSNNNNDLIIGNYIADDVKGNNYKHYPEGIQHGIQLHRKIDSFTDTHQTVKKSKDRIRLNQRKYTPVVMDVFYDYFLANNWEKYASENLAHFTNNIYNVLNENLKYLPKISKERFFYMANQNWLFNYRKLEGIKKSLTGLSQRSNYTNNMAKAHLILQEKKISIQNDFEEFYPELIGFVKDEINLILPSKFEREKREN